VLQVVIKYGTLEKETQKTERPHFLQFQDLSWVLSACFLKNSYQPRPELSTTGKNFGADLQRKVRNKTPDNAEARYTDSKQIS